MKKMGLVSLIGTVIPGGLACCFFAYFLDGGVCCGLLDCLFFFALELVVVFTLSLVMSLGNGGGPSVTITLSTWAAGRGERTRKCFPGWKLRFSEVRLRGG